MTAFWIKAIFAVVGTILLVWHMSHTRGNSWGQRLRYVALLAAGITLAYASRDQITQHLPFEVRNRFGLVTAVLLFLAAAVSLWEDYHPAKRKE